MDKLSKQQQELIRKNTDERLRLKLIRAGQGDEDAILAMDRDALLNAWAELVHTGRDKPQVAAAGDKGGAQAVAGYDTEL